MIEWDYLLWRAREAWRRPTRLGGAFRRDDRGATAVEFAMVLAPFTAIMMAMIETAIVFMAGQVLENATYEASRMILTGQAKKGNDPSQNQFDKTTFREKVCSNVPALFDCNGLVSIDVQVIKKFGDDPNFAPRDASGNYDTSNWNFDPGAGNQIVLVRAAMAFPIWISFYSTVPLANLGGGKRLIMASSAFKNEPF